MNNRIIEAVAITITSVAPFLALNSGVLQHTQQYSILKYTHTEEELECIDRIRTDDFVEFTRQMRACTDDE